MKTNSFPLSLRYVLVGIVLSAVVLLLVPEKPFAADLPAYEQAKVELDRLRNDEARAKYRHNWLKCAESFMNLYQRNADWNNRAAALFRSAEALEEMARRSFVRKDAQEAAARFEMLAEKHPASVLADDALYRAAVIRHELMRDTDDARALLQTIGKKYPKADFAPKAAEYLAGIGGTAVASLGATPTLTPPPVSTGAQIQHITPQLRSSGNIVRIVVSLDRPAPWRIKYQAPDEKAGRPSHLLLELTDAVPASGLSLDARYKDMGIFQRALAQPVAGENKTRILLDFSDIYRYTVKAEKSPFRLIIEATVKPNVLTGGITVGSPKTETASAPKPSTSTAPSAPKAEAPRADTASIPRRAPSDLTAQLGLTVKTIIIDPGHGGKDPGAMHHGIVEREACLDISRRLANVLRAAGYQVILTREKDVFLSLSDRAHFASDQKGDLFISIHVNANKSPDKAGFETYYLDFNRSKDVVNLAAVENAGSTRRLGEMESILTELLLSARVQESRRLASAIQSNALSHLKRGGHKPMDGGTRGALFHVLMNSSMPGVLVEVGYCSNEAEAKLLRQSKYRDLLAEGIANGIHQYAQQLETASK